MIKPIIMVIIWGALFTAAVLNLAADNRVRKVVLRCAIIIAAVVGAVFYGYGYAYCNGFNVSSLFRALLAMCRMLAGINDYSNVSASPLLQNSIGVALFWIGHFCGFYVTASAAITTLGEKLLRTIRATLLRRGPLLLIFGVNDASVAYAKDMAQKKHRSVLFVDPDDSSSYESTIKSFGGVIEKNGDAVSPCRRFLSRINFKPGSRRLELAAMHSDGRKNLKYASEFLDVMTEAGISPAQTSLIISGAGERASSLQVNEGKGYGSVLSFDDYELTARLVIRDHPPCGMICFDEHGKAMGDFHAVILGYGRMGRAILENLICNAQFYGSTFRTDIFDPGPQNGFLHGQKYIGLYNISFHPENGKSEGFYEYLEKNIETISCIFICTGNPDDNREIAEDLELWCGPGKKVPMIIQVSKGAYYADDGNGCCFECTNVYSSDVLDIRRIDAMAMQINHMYSGSGSDAAADWETCGYFARLSSRASADFYPAMLRASGRTAEQVLSGDWPPDEETLENLAITEHKRWCAFHHAMGFDTMPDEIYEKRAAAYLEEKEENGSSSITIGKDMEAHLHACLIPWEDLDALSERENAITGGNVDYKQLDRNNVIALSDVLRAMEQAGEGK